MFVPLESTLRATALAAAACVCVMVAIFLTTGVGQDALQFVHPAGEYAHLLLANPAALRATITIDNVFIALYATAFATLLALLLRSGAPRVPTFVAGAGLALLAMLDLLENLHFLVMLARAEQGLAPGDAEIAGQVFESLVKFHVSYVALFLLSFALPQFTRAERVLAGLLRYVQLPVGILIFVTPRAVAVPLVFMRFSFFVVSLVLLARTRGGTAKVSAGAAVDSGAPA